MGAERAVLILCAALAASTARRASADEGCPAAAGLEVPRPADLRPEACAERQALEQRARALMSAADAALAANRRDELVALEYRLVRVVRRLAPGWTSPRVRSWATDARTAYVELARDLVQSGDVLGAVAAMRFARELEGDAAEVVEMSRELEELARAAYLRGYAVHRDGGPRSTSEARRLWVVARAAAAPDSDTAQKATRLLEETRDER